MLGKYIAKEADLNNDNVKDVVVWNTRTQQPYAINGYRLKSNDWAARDMYNDTHRTADKRTEESYSDWLSGDRFWNTRVIDPKNPFRRDITVNEKAKLYKADNWKLPKHPQKDLSVYSVFCNVIKGYLTQYKDTYVANMLAELAAFKGMTPNIGNNCVEFFNKIVSPILIYRVLYMRIVLREYFWQLFDKKKVQTYSQFKLYMKQYPEELQEYFITNYLLINSDGTVAQPFQLKPDNKITAKSLNDNLSHGKLDFDGSDVDDLIIFLLGVANCNDDTFVSIICDDSKASEFLYNLRTMKDPADPKHRNPGYVEAKKLLRVFKQNATKSVKELTNTRVTEFYQHRDRKLERDEIQEHHGNVNAGTMQAAQDELLNEGEKSPIKLPNSPPRPNTRTDNAEVTAARIFINSVLNDPNWDDKEHLEVYINADGTGQGAPFDLDKFKAMINRLKNSGGIAAFDMNEYVDAMREDGTVLNFDEEA
jgi:hypothetical protein